MKHELDLMAIEIVGQYQI